MQTSVRPATPTVTCSTTNICFVESVKAGRVLVSYPQGEPRALLQQELTDVHAMSNSEFDLPANQYQASAEHWQGAPTQHCIF